MKIIKLILSSSPNTVLEVKYCDTFSSKLIGLMFSSELPPDQGIILVENRPSRLNTSIHTMFMNYDIAALWLDQYLVIVDKVLAKRWRPIYIPKKPAQYVVELHRSSFPEYSIGDRMIISEDC